MRLLGVFAVTLLLLGCDAAKHYSEVSVSRKKEYNDVQAGLYVQIPCDMTIGAYNRVLTDVQQQAIMILCGGDLENHVTAEDMQALSDFLELRERSRQP